MNTPVKLAAFGVGLAAVFGASVGVGAAVGPVGPTAEKSAPAGHEDAGHGDAGHQDAGQPEVGHQEDGS